MASKPVADSRRGTQARLGALREPGRAGIVSLVAALVPVLLICLLATPIYPMSPDEQVQQLYASGRFLGAGQQLLMPYSLVTFSAPISALYALLPAVPWYALALLGLIVASFAVAWDKTLRSRMSGRLCVPTLALLVALEVISTLYLTYTIVAFLAVGAGLMLVLGRAAFDSPGGAHATDVAGMALVVAGYSLRPESGLAAIAVFAPFVVWVLVRNRNAGSIARGVIVVALVGVCAFAGRFAYDHTPGWEGYSAYLDAGRSALDYPDLPAEAVQAVEPALSDNDVDVLYNWLFADDGVFGTEFFERLGRRVDHLGLSNLASSLRAKTTYLLVGLVALVGLYAWALVRDLGEGRGALAAGIVLMLLASCGVLILRARVRLHVVIPLVAMGVFALVSLAGGSERPVGRHAAPATTRAASPCPVPLAAACVVLALAVSGGFWLKVARPLAARSTSPTIAAARAYVDENPDQLVVFGRSQTLMFAGSNALAFEAWDWPDNMLPIGGWENHTAPWASFLARWGIEGNDVLQQLPERSDMVAVLQPKKMELIRTYLSEHGGREVEANVVQDLGPGAADPSVDVYVYRFTYAS